MGLKEDLKEMQRGTSLIFANDLSGAELVFKTGMDKACEQQNFQETGTSSILNQNGFESKLPVDIESKLKKYRFYTGSAAANNSIVNGEHTQSNGTPLPDEGKDLRGAFAALYALVSMAKGITSLASEELDECERRLGIAEELTIKGEDWIGKTVLRGIISLSLGVVQIAQHSFVKGVYNILKSWFWIRHLNEGAVNFDGPEKDIVRSSALCALAMFNILLSLLPSPLLKTASFVIGVEGNRDEGLRMLEDCWREKGVLSPYAALALVVYYVDTKTLIGERQTKEDFESCDEIFRWAEYYHPNSVFFSLIKADLAACRHNIPLARQITDAIAPHIEELTALVWVLNYKRGIFALADLEFTKAAQCFEKSLQLNEESGIESNVPFLAMYAALCYLIVADHENVIEHDKQLSELGDLQDHDISDEEDTFFVEDQIGYDFEDDEDLSNEETMDSARAAAHAEEMLALVGKYKKEPRKSWGRQDRWAFDLHKKYENGCDRMWPLLDMVECMTLRMRCSKWMNDEEAEQLMKLVTTEENERPNVGPDEKIRVRAYFAEILLRRGQHRNSLAWCDAGLKMQKELSWEGAFYGAVPMLHYIRAVNMMQTDRIFEARATLSEIETYGKGYWLYKNLMFKVTVLMKDMDQQMSDKFSHLVVKPGYGNSASIVITKEDFDRIESINVVHRCKNEEPEVLLIVWEWLCERFDISFAAFFRPDDGSDIVFVQNIDRHETTEGPVAGRYSPTKPGTLQLEW
eukprot:CAMPEP_0184020794 /NCGR_PEP_ID=MMETSP0954-20121128/9552_1 /TAXON_ID=627963 /ORGANISM="Aplanochytrium sp, Strain PBS07" /LENGTH=747 /DNA_ID=CAMNT_0026302705 /DNA_START=200 /DNA_END=2440 /DNA_ORIENTATION=+